MQRYNFFRTQQNKKSLPVLGRLGTAYQSRTDDLLRERQMSWTTRRMRHFFAFGGDFSLEIGCKSTNIFQTNKIFCENIFHIVGFQINIFYQSFVFIMQKQIRGGTKQLFSAYQHPIITLSSPTMVGVGTEMVRC